MLNISLQNDQVFLARNPSFAPQCGVNSNIPKNAQPPTNPNPNPNYVCLPEGVEPPPVSARSAYAELTSV